MQTRQRARTPKPCEELAIATDYYETLGQEDLDVGIGIVAKRNPGGGLLSTTQVNIASLAQNQARTTATWNPGTVAVGGFVSTTVAVPGAAVGDFVMVAFDQMPASSGLGICGYVTSANTVTVVISNPNVGTVQQTLGLGNLYVLTFKSR